MLEPVRKIKIRFPRKSWFGKTSLFVQITQPASYRLVYKRNIYREFNQKAHSLTEILEVERMSTCPCPDPDHNPTKHNAKSVTRTFLTAFPATAALENSGSHTKLVTTTTDRQANARKVTPRREGSAPEHTGVPTVTQRRLRRHPQPPRQAVGGAGGAGKLQRC